MQTKKLSGVGRAAMWTLVTAVIPLLGIGCGGGTGGDWLTRPDPSGETWTIRCLRSGSNHHAEMCRQMAKLMREAQGLRAELVRVESNEVYSTIYYGEYIQKTRASDGSLAFPPELQKDLSWIRQLSLRGSYPFAQASPQPVQQRSADPFAQWHVSKCKGTHTLQIAVFYNTETFSQRREAAEAYMMDIRDSGIPAYYKHEDRKSYVYVGDFDESDLVPTLGGTFPYSDRVGRLIKQRLEEFSYLLENGFRRKVTGPDGQMVAVGSQLIEVVRPGYGRY